MNSEAIAANIGAHDLAMPAMKTMSLIPEAMMTKTTNPLNHDHLTNQGKSGGGMEFVADIPV